MPPRLMDIGGTLVLTRITLRRITTFHRATGIAVAAVSTAEGALTVVEAMGARMEAEAVTDLMRRARSCRID